MKSKKTITTLLLSLSISAFSLNSVFAANTIEVQNIAPDGTIIMKEYPISPEQKALADEKEKILKLYKDAKQGLISKAEVDKAVADFEKKHMGKTTVKDVSPYKFEANATIYPNVEGASNYINNLYQQPQENYYYCGPATASSILKAKNDDIDQGTAAEGLGTTEDGTAWYNGGTSYPMRDYLNSRLYGWYAVRANPNLENFVNSITFDVDNGYGVAANVIEEAGQLHLPGHPTNQYIAHWVAIDGYSDYGNKTHYADSASGGGGLSWGDNVPPYSTINSSDFVTLVSQRGIIW